MSTRSTRQRIRASSGDARPFAGRRQVTAHAAGVDIGAHAIRACVPASDHQPPCVPLARPRLPWLPWRTGAATGASRRSRWHPRAWSGCRALRPSKPVVSRVVCAAPTRSRTCLAAQALDWLARGCTLCRARGYCQRPVVPTRLSCPGAPSDASGLRASRLRTFSIGQKPCGSCPDRSRTSAVRARGSPDRVGCGRALRASVPRARWRLSAPPALQRMQRRCPGRGRARGAKSRGLCCPTPWPAAISLPPRGGCAMRLLHGLSRSSRPASSLRPPHAGPWVRPRPRGARRPRTVTTPLR